VFRQGILVVCWNGRLLCLKRLAIRLGLAHHRCINTYSEDLRKKIVEAKERGVPNAEVARAFGVSLSSVKRYAKTARQGGSLRPKKSPGRPPKADQRARCLSEADLRDRPAATLSERREYLRGVAGLRVSESNCLWAFEAYGVQQ
jgi:transposase